MAWPLVGFYQAIRGRLMHLERVARRLKHPLVLLECGPDDVRRIVRVLTPCVSVVPTQYSVLVVRIL